MPRYRHTVVIMNVHTTPQEGLQDEDPVYQIEFRMITRELTTGARVMSDPISALLPPADSLNFIPRNQIDDKLLNKWIEEHVDILALQEQNIEKLSQ